MGEDRASQMALVVKSPPANAGNIKDLGLSPRVGKIPWRRAWQPTPVFMPGKSQGQRSLEGYSLWGRKESTMTEVTQCTCTHRVGDGVGGGGMWTGRGDKKEPG